MIKNRLIHHMRGFIGRDVLGQDEVTHFINHPFQGGFLHAHLRLRFIQNPLVLTSRPDTGGQYPDCPLRRHLKINREIQIHAEVRLGFHVVGYNGVSQLAVGHHHHVIARGAQTRGAPVDLDHLGHDVCLHAVLVHHDPVAHLERAIHVDGQPHEEIKNHRSQRQSDHNANRA